ncbi:MAG: hypothetical protein ACKV2O_00760 [Acidimicrobiales bacterium]
MISPGSEWAAEWDSSEDRDLSVRPLCQEGSSWYVLGLEPTASEGKPLTINDVSVLEIVEGRCWNDKDASYDINLDAD